MGFKILLKKNVKFLNVRNLSKIFGGEGHQPQSNKSMALGSQLYNTCIKLYGWHNYITYIIVKIILTSIKVDVTIYYSIFVHQ